MKTSERPSLQPLAADTVAGGDMIAEFNKALGQIIADIYARPDILKKRKITLTLSLEPKGEAGLDMIGLDYQLSTAVPSRLGKRQTAFMQIDPATGEETVLVKVDTGFPGNDPNQTTILDFQKEAN